jgi:anti-sigma B factor antagonist
LSVNLHVERPGDESVPVVAVHGDLDLDTAHDLRGALIETIDEHPGLTVIVDLEGVEFIDSAGLGVLLGGRERARTRDGDLVLVATGRSVVRVLELTGLTRVFEIHASRVAALGDS